MFQLQSISKQRQFVKQTSLVRVALLVAILEKSILPLLLLFPSLRQELLNQEKSEKIAVVEKQSSATSIQISTLTPQVEEGKSETKELAQTVRIQQTRQRLVVAAIQKLQYENKVLHQQSKNSPFGYASDPDPFVLIQISRIGQAANTAPPYGAGSLLKKR